MIGIKFCSLASSSSGNVQYLETKETKILIDSGLSGKQTELLLESIQVDPRELNGILLTHEHRDHSLGAGVLSRKYSLPIYTNQETWDALKDFVGPIQNDNIKIYDRTKAFSLRDLWVTPVEMYHDAAATTGYTIEIEDQKLSIVTDTGWVCDDMIEKIKDSDFYFIESNHDIELLKNGRYPWHLKQRILSTRGHLSNVNTAKVLRKLIKGTGETVLLGHLSRDNNTEELAYETSSFALGDEGRVVGEDDEVYISVAPEKRATKVFDVKRS